jgi:hypothetical protein
MPTRQVRSSFSIFPRNPQTRNRTMCRSLIPTELHPNRKTGAKSKYRHSLYAPKRSMTFTPPICTKSQTFNKFCEYLPYRLLSKSGEKYNKRQNFIYATKQSVPFAAPTSKELTTANQQYVDIYSYTIFHPHQSRNARSTERIKSRPLCEVQRSL